MCNCNESNLLIFNSEPPKLFSFRLKNAWMLDKEAQQLVTKHFWIHVFCISIGTFDFRKYGNVQNKLWHKPRQVKKCGVPTPTPSRRHIEQHLLVDTLNNTNTFKGLLHKENDYFILVKIYEGNMHENNDLHKVIEVLAFSMKL